MAHNGCPCTTAQLRRSGHSVSSHFKEASLSLPSQDTFPSRPLAAARARVSAGCGPRTSSWPSSLSWSRQHLYLSQYTRELARLRLYGFPNLSTWHPRHPPHSRCRSRSWSPALHAHLGAARNHASSLVPRSSLSPILLKTAGHPMRRCAVLAGPFTASRAHPLALALLQRAVECCMANLVRTIRGYSYRDTR